MAEGDAWEGQPPHSFGKQTKLPLPPARNELSPSSSNALYLVAVYPHVILWIEITHYYPDHQSSHFRFPKPAGTDPMASSFEKSVKGGTKIKVRNILPLDMAE